MNTTPVPVADIPPGGGRPDTGGGAVTRIRIEVTAEDIAAGLPGKSQACPVACAIKRRPGFSDASVSAVEVGYRFDGLWYWGHTPPDKAAQFIYDFDHGKPVEPFAFYLEGPPRPSPADPPADSPHPNPTVASQAASG